MKTDFIAKSCEASACRQNFMFPKALSVSHRNNMKVGLRHLKLQGNRGSRHDTWVSAITLSPGVRAGGHLEFKEMSKVTLLLYVQAPSLLS